MAGHTQMNITGKFVTGILLKKAVFTGVVFSFIIFFTLVTSSLIIDDSPLVLEAQDFAIKNAVLARTLSVKVRSILCRPKNIELLTVSEDDMNSVLGFAARAIPDFKAKAEITHDRFEIKGTYILPKNPVGKYFNCSISFGTGLSLFKDLQERGLTSLGFR